MTKFYVEVVVHGRVNLTVEAADEASAISTVWDHPGFPDLDKVYESEANVVGHEQV